MRFMNSLITMGFCEPTNAGTNSVMPKMSVVLKKLAPIMLPRAKLGCPRRIDFTPIVSSGMLVPSATIVAPITCWDTPAEVAMVIADSTR